MASSTIGSDSGSACTSSVRLRDSAGVAGPRSTLPELSRSPPTSAEGLSDSGSACTSSVRLRDSAGVAGPRSTLPETVPIPADIGGAAVRLGPRVHGRSLGHA